MRYEYERAYDEAINGVYGNIKDIRLEEGRNIWNMQSSENRGNVDRNSRQNRGEISELDVTGNNENLRASDKGEPNKVKFSLDVPVEMEEIEMQRQLFLQKK